MLSLASTLELSPEDMPNFCLMLDDINSSFTAESRLRMLVALEELPAICDTVNTHCPMKVQVVSSLSALCPVYLVLA